MPHSQGLSNNHYPEPLPTQFLVLIHISLGSILILSSHLRLGVPKGLFPLGLPVKILEALLISYSIFVFQNISRILISFS